MEKEIGILSINVNGLDDNKTKQILKLAKNYNVICLQETHNMDKRLVHYIEDKLNAIFIIQNDPIATRSGVGMIINSQKTRQNWKLINTPTDLQGRILHIELNGIHIINIYAPAKRKQRIHFLYKLSNYIHQYNRHNLVLIGDFNSIVTDIDKRNGMKRWDRSMKHHILGLITNNNLIDTFRYLHPAELKFTYIRENTASRIDHAYVTNNFITKIIDSKIREEKIGDHNAIELTVKEENDSRWGKTHWKFNNSLLQSQNFTDEIEEFLHGLDDTHIYLYWDKIKRK